MVIVLVGHTTLVYIRILFESDQRFGLIRRVSIFCTRLDLLTGLRVIKFLFWSLIYILSFILVNHGLSTNRFWKFECLLVLVSLDRLTLFFNLFCEFDLFRWFFSSVLLFLLLGRIFFLVSLIRNILMLVIFWFFYWRWTFVWLKGRSNWIFDVFLTSYRLQVLLLRASLVYRGRFRSNFLRRSTLH